MRARGAGRGGRRLRASKRLRRLLVHLASYRGILESLELVPRLAEGNAATLPNFTVDWVVTEYGSARLSGCTIEERAEALRAIAAPEKRSEL